MKNIRKHFILFLFSIVPMSLLLISCHKDKPNNNDDMENRSTGTVVYNAVTDIDGNHYDAVWIGNQLWMKENLRTTHFADGSVIDNGIAPADSTSYGYPRVTSSFSVPYRYAPATDESNVPDYGYLYNWQAVMHGAASSSANPSGVQGICPQGWHVPSDAEWTEMENTLIDSGKYHCGDCENCIAKALASKTGWRECTGGGWSYYVDCSVCNEQNTNNATNFTALPAGRIARGENISLGYITLFWSATESGLYEQHDSNPDGSDTTWFEDYAWLRWFNFYYTELKRKHNAKDGAYSVRCVRD